MHASARMLMKDPLEFVDERHKAWCVHCGAVLKTVESNLDHVPSQSILDRPFPDNLSKVRIGRACNTSFSNDEEYFLAFLGSVLAGTTVPDRQLVKRAEKALANNVRLQNEIEAQRRVEKDTTGKDRVTFLPDTSRIRNVVVKNARGHVLFEHGQPALGEPAHCAFTPLILLADMGRRAFETIDYGHAWPEVGSRLMTRLVTGDDMRTDGWVIVQPDVYRFAVMDNGQFVVRTVIREYLATEVIWDY